MRAVEKGFLELAALILDIARKVINLATNQQTENAKRHLPGGRLCITGV